MSQQHIEAALAAHCQRYPLLQAEDVLKWIHQSSFGCGHLVQQPGDAADRIRRELAACPASAAQDIEALDGGFCRVHLGHLGQHGISPDSFARLFALSTTMPTDGQVELRLQSAAAMAQDGLFPFSGALFTQAAETWKARQFPALHHSAAFRTAYAPAYRVMHHDHAALLPLLGDIDTLLAKQPRVILTIEGGAGSGKSTLAALLHRIYNCTVLHMDDFFLRPHQRTPERYAQCGGNVDYERFSDEVVQPLTRGEELLYRPFDCSTMSLCSPQLIRPTPLTVVEGAYSMHPALGAYYDYALFLQIEPQAQRQRILQRNSPAMAQRFFDVWIPLEHAYFHATDPAGRCQRQMEVT